MKTSLTLCATAALLLASFSAGNASPAASAASQECAGFPDVPEGHWASGAVMRLKCAGIVQGASVPVAAAPGKRSTPPAGGNSVGAPGDSASILNIPPPAKGTGRMQIEAGSRLVMIGDSITDAGRGRPVGERAKDGLGLGYVREVDSLLGAVYPDRNIRALNTGISGNTVRDLKNRWQADVIDLNPDWLSIMIGTNDVWRQFDSPNNPEIHVLPEEFERTLDELVAKTRPSVKGLVVMTPFYVQPDPQDPMRARMDEYGRIVKRIGEKHGVTVVDTQAAFNEAMKHHDPLALAGDRVHPSALGHMVLARAFLNAVGFEWR